MAVCADVGVVVVVVLMDGAVLMGGVVLMDGV